MTPDQARRLCEIAGPARYGLREQTLLDPNVRDTWEIPRDRVTIDRERWQATVAPVLDAMRTELGVAPGRALSAEFHSMLVYATGQFFRRHQDSEKADGMVGTLVVTLPSTFTGGDLVIEHRGQRVADEDWMCGRRRRWVRVDGSWKIVGEHWQPIDIDGEDELIEDVQEESPTAADHPERFGSLREEEKSSSRTTLIWWIDRSGDRAVQTELSIARDELCPRGTESVVYPYAFESEGFMGNEGNTMERWYRRAAIVVWARERPVELPAIPTVDSAAR